MDKNEEMAKKIGTSSMVNQLLSSTNIRGIQKTAELTATDRQKPEENRLASGWKYTKPSVS